MCYPLLYVMYIRVYVANARRQSSGANIFAKVEYYVFIAFCMCTVCVDEVVFEEQ